MLSRVDSAREIENLLYTYAERIDAGDLDGVADLFAHGRIHGQEDGPPETVFEGRDAVRELYGMATRIYEDTGTPKTKHLTTNAIIEVDDDAGTATARTSYLVTQATDELPLQVIITGHYHDTFHRDRRRVVVRHPDHVRRPDRRPQPPPEVLILTQATWRPQVPGCVRSPQALGISPGLVGGGSERGGHGDHSGSRHRTCCGARGCPWPGAHCVRPVAGGVVGR